MRANSKALSKTFGALVLLVPFLLPFFVEGEYYVHGILGRIFIYTILVVSLDLVVGYIGDISIGHVGLFAIGSYSVAVLTASHAMNPGSTMLYMPELNFFVALAVGIVLAALFGVILGFPSLRSSGPYLAVSTIAFGTIVSTIINEQEALTNGTKGITVGPVSAFGIEFSGNKFIWLVYPALLLVIWMMQNLKKSYWGRAFEAIKFSAIAAEASGIKRSYFKISAFVMSAAFAGLAGGLFTQLDQYISASTFTLDFSILALIALIFGGLRSSVGNVIGMALVVILPDVFTWFKDFRLLVFGVLLLLTLFFLPQGVGGFLTGLYRKLFLKTIESHEQEQQLQRWKNSQVPLFSNEVGAQKAQRLVLSVSDLEMRFGGLIAVNGLSLEVRSGHVLGLMGPNGSGKSTTVNLISGIYQPTQGQIFFYDKSIEKMPPHERARLGLARTFQNLQLFSDLTVLENVVVGFHVSYKSSLWQILLGLPQVSREEDQLKNRAYQLLKLVNLDAEAFSLAKNLAYGQARRLEIARALALQPQLLLLDEPAAGLTTSEIQEFNQIILKLRDQGVAILLIEHHMDMIMQVSDHIVVLDFGKKISEGVPSVVQSDPKVISAYLGVEANQ